MNVQMITPGLTPQASTESSGAELIKKSREKAQDIPAQEEASQAKKNEIQPEELLQNIKALTDNGLYSVRFEMYKDTDELVIHLIDRKTGDVIRQIPPEEILGLHKTLRELRGNLLETQS